MCVPNASAQSRLCIVAGRSGERETAACAAAVFWKLSEKGRSWVTNDRCRCKAAFNFVFEATK